MYSSVILAGLPGSGKTSVAELLHNMHGLRVINVGDLLLQQLEREGVSCKSRADIGPTFLKLHEPDAIFQILRDAFSTPEGQVIDGIRLLRTCQQLRRWLPTARVWFITCDEAQRLQRLRSKVKVDQQRRDQANEEFARYSAYDDEAARIAALADVVLSTDGVLEELQMKVKQCYSQKGSRKTQPVGRWH
jgi:dephospho-CoA kinase